MSKRIVQTGFTVTPLMGVLDDETDVVTPVPLQPISVSADGLAVFAASEWPAQLAAMRHEFTKAMAAEETAAAARQRDLEALAAAATPVPKPPRDARRAAKKATGAKKAPRKRAPARKK